MLLSATSFYIPIIPHYECLKEIKTNTTCTSFQTKPRNNDSRKNCQKPERNTSATSNLPNPNLASFQAELVYNRIFQRETKKKNSEMYYIPEVEWHSLLRSSPWEILLTATNDPRCSSISTSKPPPYQSNPTFLCSKIHEIWRSSKQSLPNPTASDPEHHHTPKRSAFYSHREIYKEQRHESRVFK